MDDDKKILIVDDSSIVANIVKNILTENRFSNISVSSSVDEAIEKFNNDKYDLLLVDYNMPEKNGDILLDYVKEKNNEIIVIMLSGQQDKDIVVKLMRKANDYIIKDDVSAIKDELIHSIKHAIEIQNLRKENKKLIDDIKGRNEQLEKELDIAGRLLKEIYPKEIAKSEIFDIELYNRAYDIIGGDFYYIDRLDANNINIFIGDICGHGLEAALLLFTLSNALKEAIKNCFSTRETLEKLNASILTQFPSGFFVTCCYFIFNERSNTFELSTAFDTSVLYLKHDKTIDEIKNETLPYLGIVNLKNESLANINFIKQTRITLEKNEKIFVFTDGVTEAKDGNENLFGMERIKKIVINNSEKKIAEVINLIYNSIKDFSGNKFSDDITIIGIELK